MKTIQPLDNQQPLFRHDCDGCRYLGSVQTDERGQGLVAADVYVCPGASPTVVARFSDEPSDNISGLIFARTSPSLGLAKRRALAAGLLRAKRPASTTRRRRRTSVTAPPRHLLRELLEASD